MFTAPLRSLRRRMTAAALIAFALSATLTAIPAVASPADKVSLADLDITGLQQLLTEGTLTSVDLVTMYEARIAAYDDDPESGIAAVIALNPDAISDAGTLDAERAAGAVRGPLHGIPVLIKDNIDVAGMPTTGGSNALRDFVPNIDSTQVAMLREAGAIILAKTNLHEFATGITTLSSLGGQTRNPYDLTRDPGGSSGGTAAGVASAFAPAGLGSDTGGSVRIPASHNSLVGLRPTFGLSSRHGVLPISYSQDSVGPIATTVRDVALLMDATVGADPKDRATQVSQRDAVESYVDALSKTTLDGATIGLVVNPEFLGTGTESEQQTTTVIRAAVAELEGRGAMVSEVTLPDEIVKNLTGDAIPFYEARRDMNAYFAEEDASFPAELAALAEPLDTLTVSDLVASGDVGEVVAPLLAAADGITLPSADYDGLLAIRDDLQASVATFFAEGEYDALVYPSLRQPGAPLGDAPPKKEAADLVGIIGYPAISVPAGVTSDGMPVGLELLGTPFSEAALLGYAYDYEQATHHRVPPTSVPALAGEEITLSPAETGSAPVGLIVTICVLALLVVLAAVVIVLRRRSRTVS